MESGYTARIVQAGAAIKEADYILIGGGAELSDAAGLEYTGKRFTESFAPFIKKYGFKDLYSSSFYPFETQEERWAYWAKHISINRYEPTGTQLYKNILRIVQDKEFFVITTNVDYQFHKSGYPEERIFMVQGDYGYFQCERGCHDMLYDNEAQVSAMIAYARDCRIPSHLVPKCPRCGGAMDTHVHHNQYFVRNQAWFDAESRYNAFVKRARHRKIVCMELGVGFNTPGIIRFPFEQITLQNSKATLVRLNRDYPYGEGQTAGRTIAFSEDMADTIAQLLANKCRRTIHV